jgi:hypothetical protein
MKRVLPLFLLVALLALLTASAALAQEGEPVAGCPVGFHLHLAGHHDEDHGAHMHVGIDADLNGDGWICVKHITPDGGIHVHIDNNVPQ